MENFKKITKQQSPARTIAFGFAVLIFIGAALLSLPIAVRGAVQLPGLDALFTATSAVCVTGLVTVDPGDTFTLFGQAVLAVLMQLGGLGISSVSMGLAIAAGRRISFRGRSLVREALNVESFGGMVKLVRSIMAMTLLVEGIGAVASYRCLPGTIRRCMPPGSACSTRSLPLTMQGSMCWRRPQPDPLLQ